ncbi:MAG: glycerophosphoryl diester phosphodiesterase membrane domain-containing protein [Bacilli bacterium]|nr:glycerophosphoryl diester phosphodiesterase membrane domain-containing protein [Bacilli bacterium]
MKNNYIKNISNMIGYNLKTLIKFEIIYKAILSIILIPFAISGFSLAMKLTGYTYLTLENIVSFLLNPITLFMLILIIIYLTIVTIFDITTIIVLFDISSKKEKIGVLDLLKLSINKCKKVFNFKNISVAFLVLFLIPFLNIGISSNVITSIKLPEFIMDYINSNYTLSIIYVLVYLLLLSIMSKWLYSLHYMILEDKSFKEARKSSKDLIKKSRLVDLLKIFLVQIITSVIYTLVVMLGIVIIMLISKILGNLKVIESVSITIVWLLIVVCLIIFAFISNSISFATISAMFYKHKTDKKEKIKHITYKETIKDKKHSTILKYIITIVVLLSVIAGSLFTYQVITGETNLNIKYIRKMEITAHRGASVKYPENTMAAFRGAKKLGADWIELDVQQTKDRQIVVSHDTNLGRVTGVDKDIIDMNYSEIEKLDAGSFFNKKFKDEKIPLLKEALQYAKDNNIRLNIELKPIGEEKDFEKQVVDLIKKYKFENRCVITSQIYSVLEKVKKEDKEIKTVYVMSIAIGEITDAKYADAFSVEASNVNESLVNTVHNSGKELFAWTINTEESINNMIDMDVDNIITDNIQLGKKLVEKSKSSDLISEFMKSIYK